MTIQELIQEIIRVFKKVGIENAEAEAKLLACHILSCDNSYLFFHQNEEIDDKVLLASAALINERCKGRPVQYVMGKTSFYGIDITVDERVLIPRPETEILVENALRSIKESGKESPRILDLCTGSGCIAAAAAANCPGARITASELSPKAFMLARYNLRAFENVEVVRGDLFEPSAGKKYDYILTNPPYIPTDVIPTLQKEVKDYEPHMALDGGKSGLDIVGKIINEAHLYLEDGGMLFMEIGADQGKTALELAEKTGKYTNISIIKDLEGHDRIIKAVKL